MLVRRLPYEIIAYIAQSLDISDVFNLSLTCQHFQYLIHEKNICKTVLEVTYLSSLSPLPSPNPRQSYFKAYQVQSTSPAAPETQLARRNGKYAAALRRLAKRRMAISSASPFLTAVVAYCQFWIYENGVLCYTRGCELRILDVHGSASQEMVIDTERLLRTATQDFLPGSTFKFRPLFYSNDTVSGVFLFGGQRVCKWLVALNPIQNQIVATIALQSSSEIFVRNNDRYLVYGTYSGPRVDGFKRWVFFVVDIQEGEKLVDNIRLSRIIGSDVGSTVYFDIIDGFFYGISNQTNFEAEERDWASYYHCFRFPLGPSGSHAIEWAPEPQMWRRQQTEGPIDDGWTFLRIYKDDGSGKLKVMESRKEWLSGHSSATRTYYSQKILFSGDEEDGAEDEYGERGRSVGSLYPVYDTMAAYTRKEVAPNPKAVPYRRAEDVQLGDDGSVSIMFTPSKCFIRSYYPACQSFLDLVDDSLSPSPEYQRLRIRVGSRCLREAKERRKRLYAGKQKHGDYYSLRHKIEDLYEHKSVVFWPPDGPSTGDGLFQEKLHKVLNPPGYVGNVRGAWDDRSLVYSTGGASQGSIRALVLIGFDPSIQLENIQSFDQLGRKSDCVSAQPPQRYQAGSRDIPGQEKEPAACANPADPMWAVYKPALYHSINRGFNFAK